MFSETEVVDILSNDIRLWEQYTTVTVDPSSGRATAELAAGIMPDGKPCRGALEPASRLSLVSTWYNYVRGQYDARKNEQEAKTLERAEALRASSSRKSPPAPVDGGGEVAVAQASPDGETSMVAVLESKIAAVRRSQSSIKVALEGAVAEVDRLRGIEQTLARSLAGGIAALKVVRDMEKSNG